MKIGRKNIDWQSLSKIQKKKTERIRDRHSYDRWNTIYKDLRLLIPRERIAQVMRLIHKYIDGMFGYKTSEKAYWSEESLEQFLKDKDLK